jgi:uncharacterized protein (TIGR02147 family)
MTNPLDIFVFSDYRKFIQTWLERAREAKTSNLSRLAQSIGVHTSFLAHVLSGSKHLSFEQASELAEAFELTQLEQDYFFALIQVDRAGTLKLKNYWNEKRIAILRDRAKLSSRVGTHHELTTEERAVFYSSWIYVAIYVATAIDDGQNLEQLTQRFHLSREKAIEILDFLVRIGVCENVGAKYKMGKAVVYLANESPLVVKHHTNWRLRAIQKMDSRESSELFFTSPMSMSKSDFARVREEIAKCIETSLEICKESAAEEVVCLNIDFFRGMAN